MNWQTIVRAPVRVTFGHLADPVRLGDWLPEVTGPSRPAASAGDAFELSIAVTAGSADGLRSLVAQTGGGGDGEVTAFEPPWLVGYRLFVGGRSAMLRVTCAAHAGATQVRLHQAGDFRLAVDLDRVAALLDQDGA